MVKDKQKAIFSENLNSYIAKSEKTQLEIAKSIGVSPQTFNTWCKGIAIPRMGKVQALADYFNINKSDLIEDKKLNIDTVPIESGYTIPVLGRVAAGYGKEAVEEEIGQIEISHALAAKGVYFGLLLKGASVLPTNQVILWLLSSLDIMQLANDCRNMQKGFLSYHRILYMILCVLLNQK